MRVHQAAFIGGSGVGKSHLLHLMSGGRVAPSPPTVGVDYVTLRTADLTLYVWDCSGAAHYHSIMRAYVQKCEYVLMMYRDNNVDDARELSLFWRPLFKNIPFIVIHRCETGAAVAARGTESAHPDCIGVVRYTEGREADVLRDIRRLLLGPPKESQCGCAGCTVS